MFSYLDNGDHVVCTWYQRASWKDELIVGLFEDMTIICRAMRWTPIRNHLMTKR
jgi:hypothetical protein